LIVSHKVEEGKKEKETQKSKKHTNNCLNLEEYLGRLAAFKTR